MSKKLNVALEFGIGEENQSTFDPCILFDTGDLNKLFEESGCNLKSITLFPTQEEAVAFARCKNEEQKLYNYAF